MDLSGRGGLGPGLALCLAAFLVAPSVAAPQPTDPEPAWYLRGSGGACELFVQEYGLPAADTVIVLHGGWGAEHGYLLPALEGLADGRHLVFYDQRGSLRSPCPDSLVSLDAHLSDLDRLRRELDLEAAVLFGHSAGTWLALFYLRRHPEGVRGLVLAAANPLAAAKREEVRALMKKQAEAKEEFGDREVCRREVVEEGLARPDSSLSDEERTAKWRIRYACSNVVRVDRWRRVPGGRAFWDGSAARATVASLPAERGAYDFAAEVEAHDCPVVVLSGDHDFGRYADELHRELTEPLAGVELTVLEDAAHMPWVDRPDRWTRALGRALERAAECPP